MSVFSEIIGTIVIYLTLSIIIWKLLKLIWTCGLGYALGFGVKWCPAPDVWAVVTGGTDGIGLEYAKQLAQKGYSILILSRNEEKLKRVADDIKRNNSKCKEVKILAVDFQRTDIYMEIKNIINSLKNIDVLINNVGITNSPEYFTDLTSQYNESLVNINIISQMKMCEMILPKMVNQKRGIIINLSSTVAINPPPLFTVYAASKAFNDFFSRGLSIEYAKKGIIIQTVLPGFVKTNMIPDGFPEFLPLTAEQFVSAAIKTVGIEWLTYGHWKHKIFAFILKFLRTVLGSKSLCLFSLKCLENARKSIREFQLRNK